MQILERAADFRTLKASPKTIALPKRIVRAAFTVTSYICFLDV